MDSDYFKNSIYRLYDDMTKLHEAVDKIHDKLYHFENLKDDIKNVEKKLKNKIDNLSEYCYPIGSYGDIIISLENKCDTLEKEMENFKAERENKSSNNYLDFIIAVFAFITLLVSAICCGIFYSNRVKVEETPTEMRINLDNPQNKDIQLNINHG